MPADEKVEASKATGAKVTITVYFRNFEDDVEVLETIKVKALRDAIKATFSPLFDSYAPAQLVVLTKDATGKLNPLGPNAVIADELGKDGKFEVWVEVPEKAAGSYFVEVSFSGGFVSAKLLLKNDQNQPVTADAELKRGDLVRVEGAGNNERDKQNDIANRPFVISQPLLEFLTFFWSNYDEGMKEFNIMGSSGVGKSCAVKVLAAEISRKRPDITLFYSRDSLVKQSDIFDSLKAAKRPTIAIFDQIQSEDTAKELGAFGDIPDLTMVLISSANLQYFRTDRQGRQHDKLRYEFRFGNSGGDCADAFMLSSVDFEPKDPSFESLARADPKTFLEMCEWTNGHLGSLSLLVVQKKTPKELMQDIAELMAQYFAQEDRIPLYLAVVRMFKTKSKAVPLDGAQPDSRYMTPTGTILSPLYLKAYEECLLNLPPPPARFFSTRHSELHKYVAQKSIAAEILQDIPIADIVSDCLKKLGNEIPLSVPYTRIRYGEFSQLAKEVAHFVGGGKGESELKFSCSSSPPPTSEGSWAVHGIPVIWNEDHIDGLHAYCLNGQLFVIGFSISFQTAQEHAESLRWFEDLSIMRTELGVNGANAQFILLFVSKPTESATLASPPIPKDCTVMDYPITRAASQAVQARFKLSDGDKDKKGGPRVLEVVEGKKRKSPDKQLQEVCLRHKTCL